MERTHSNTVPSGLSRWRVALVVSIAVALSLTVAVVALKCFTGPRWRGLVRPLEEELDITGVVDVGGSVGAPAAQPLSESLDLWKHRSTS
jgi:hypothetical protein